MEVDRQYFIPILVITFILLAPEAHSKTPVSTTQYKVPTAYTNFILNSCKTTTYPSLCRKALSPYASAVKTNALKLCTTALTVAIDYTRNCSTSVSKLASRNDITRTEGRAVKDCIGDLKDAIYELRQTVGALGHLGDADREFQWANAKTYASAAITDAETCVDDMLGQKVNASVKKKIRRCVSGAEQHISNALALINHLY